jgi:hypothetical protein
VIQVVKRALLGARSTERISALTMWEAEIRSGAVSVDTALATNRALGIGHTIPKDLPERIRKELHGQSLRMLASDARVALRESDVTLATRMTVGEAHLPTRETRVTKRAAAPQYVRLETSHADMRNLRARLRSVASIGSSVGAVDRMSAMDAEDATRGPKVLRSKLRATYVALGGESDPTALAAVGCVRRELKAHKPRKRGRRTHTAPSW